jgi:hypothetical protein
MTTTYTFHHTATPSATALETAEWSAMEMSPVFDETFYSAMVDGEEVYKVVYADGSVEYTDDYSYDECEWDF